MQTKNSGYALVVLLISVLLLALLSIYVMNKVYFKQAEKIREDNGVEFQAPNLQNAQNQVDSAREKIKDIENTRNKQLEEEMAQ